MRRGGEGVGPSSEVGWDGRLEGVSMLLSVMSVLMSMRRGVAEEMTLVLLLEEREAEEAALEAAALVSE